MPHDGVLLSDQHTADRVVRFKILCSGVLRVFTLRKQTNKHGKERWSSEGGRSPNPS